MTPTETRPVAQVQNPVQAPEFKKWLTEIRPETKLQFDEFCERHGYFLKDVLDSALLDYIDNHAKLSA